jgi:hypothetical protein
VRLIRWTTETADQFEAVVKHIQQEKPAAGRNVAQTVIDALSNWQPSPASADPER